MLKKFALPIGLLVVWQVASMLTTPLFIPSPLATLVAFLNLIETGQLLKGLVFSFSRITLAATISMCLAVPIAILLFVCDSFKAMLLPVTSTMRYIPVTAFSPLLILWFGIDEAMKISFLCLATFVYMLPSTLLCFEDVPQDLIDTGKSIGMKTKNIIFDILLPASLPSIANSFLMMYGIGWTYAAVVEAVNAKNGLGFIINVSAARGKTAVVFAAILAIIIFSYCFDKLGHSFIHKKFEWRYLDAED